MSLLLCIASGDINLDVYRRGAGNCMSMECSMWLDLRLQLGMELDSPFLCSGSIRGGKYQRTTQDPGGGSVSEDPAHEL